MHGIAIPIPGHSTESQKHEPMSSKVVEVNKPVGEQPPLQEACPHTNDTSAITSLASLVPLPSGFTISRPLWEHSDNEQSSFLLDMSSPTACDHKPLNLVQKALDIAPPHSKRSEEQVTATAISSTEQLVEPCTQKTGSLLGHRADSSHLSNSSFSLGSSNPKPYRHPEQSPSLRDDLFGHFPGECHRAKLLQQPVFSLIVQLTSCELQASYTNADCKNTISVDF